MKKLAIIVAAGVAVAMPLGMSATPQTQAQAATATKSHTYQVAIGFDTTLSNVTINKFIPDHLVVHVGDKVTFTNAVPQQPQTATFGPATVLPPLVLNAQAPEINPDVAKQQGPSAVGDVSSTVYSSGALMSGVKGFKTSYTFSFPRVGSYLYTSYFHPSTQGEIDVVPANKSASPYNPDRGPSMFDAMHSLGSIVQQLSTVDTGATNLLFNSFTIQVGVGDKNLSFNNLVPSAIAVPLSTTVTWTTSEMSGDLHALIFQPTTAQSQQLQNPTLYTGRASDGGILLNPAYAVTSLLSGKTVNQPFLDSLSTITGGSWSSGIIYGTNPNAASDAVVSTYKLKFTVPGSFQYNDAFHPGVFGKLIVVDPSVLQQQPQQ